MRFRLPLIAGALLAAACAAAPSRPAPPPVTSPSAAASPAPPPAREPAAIDPEPCGALGCRAFSSVERAFEAVLAERPRVLAVGEAHAQKGSEGVDSSTKRFTEQLLPKLEGKATDLVLELWVADGSCGKQEQQVAQQQKPVTETQAESNQNEFTTLGHRSKALSIRPHVLRPSCEQYERILAAQDDVGQMLTMIAEHTAELVERILSVRNAPDKLVIAYGGAMHNDLSPRQGRESTSFGPRLQRHTGGRYVELDIIVPEYIKDSDAWRALPWHAHYDRAKLGKRTVLFNPEPGSYVLVFPETTPAGP
jgi:hypothetical protein